MWPPAEPFPHFVGRGLPDAPPSPLPLKSLQDFLPQVQAEQVVRRFSQAQY